jgi:hypothetical protein
MSLFAELKRRNVFRVGIAYAVVAWLVMQIGEVMAPALYLPDWVLSTLAFFLILGFPVVLVMAWVFELTPEGIKREKEVGREGSITHTTGRKLDYFIIAMLVVVAGYFIWESRFAERAPQAATVTDTPVSFACRFMTSRTNGRKRRCRSAKLSPSPWRAARSFSINQRCARSR